MTLTQLRPKQEVPAPLRTGIGLRARHYAEILAEPGHGQFFFEALTDNYLRSGGKAEHFLRQIAERAPIVLHGVGLSIGSPEPLDWAYLRRIKQLSRDVGALWVTDHLCFTRAGGRETHDLLPVPYTSAHSRRIAARARAIQDFLELPFGLENTSSYLTLRGNEWTEWEFLRETILSAGVGLLLDVNNIVVSAKNHGFEPEHFLAAVPAESILQMHLAGHSDHGTHLIDTHVGPVPDVVTRLFESTLKRWGAFPTSLEWDTDIPNWPTLLAETGRLAALAAPYPLGRFAPTAGAELPTLPERSRDMVGPSLETIAEDEPLHALAHAVRGAPTLPAEAYVLAQGPLAPAARLAIYQSQFQLRHEETLAEDFPRTKQKLGAERWNALARTFLQSANATDAPLEELGASFALFLGAQLTRSEKKIRDLCEWEWRLASTFGAPLHSPLTLQGLGLWSAADFEQHLVRTQPSLRWASATFDLHGFWAQTAPEAELADAPTRHWGIFQGHQYRTQILETTSLERDLLENLAAPTTIAQACNRLTKQNPSASAVLAAKLSGWVWSWVERGLLTEHQTDSHHPSTLAEQCDPSDRPH
jgi:uncharacterized protein